MADKPRIALCLEYPLALRGGVSVLVESLIEGLASQYDFLLVSPDSSTELAQSSVSTLIQGHLRWDPANPTPRRSHQLALEIRDAGASMAHFHLGGNFGWGNRFRNHSPMTHLAKMGVPVCSSVHLVVNVLDGYCGPQKPFWFKLAMLPLAWLGKMQTLRHLRAEIAVSRHDLQKLQRWYWPQSGKFRQIYHSRLRAASRPEPANKREQAVLNVGHVASRKGQGILAAAFARVASKFPDWKLWLVGDIVEESEGNKIREIARSHGLEDRVLLIGPRNDAYDWMSRCGVYVQPSLAEALGLALQEAMFRGCPAIGTRAGGIPELIDHEATGLLVDAGNEMQLAAALETLMADHALRDKYGRAAPASILRKGMTFEKMLEQHAELYRAILGDTKAD